MPGDITIVGTTTRACAAINIGDTTASYSFRVGSPCALRSKYSSNLNAKGMSIASGILFGVPVMFGGSRLQA